MDDGYNQYMLDAQASGADQMQEAIESHIENLVKQVLENVISVRIDNYHMYDMIEADTFKRIFEEWIK